MKKYGYQLDAVGYIEQNDLDEFTKTFEKKLKPFVDSVEINLDKAGNLDTINLYTTDTLKDGTEKELVRLVHYNLSDAVSDYNQSQNAVCVSAELIGEVRKIQVENEKDEANDFADAINDLDERMMARAQTSSSPEW